MKRVFLNLCFLLLCFGAAAADLLTYSLGVPMPVALPRTTTGVALDDTWYRINSVYVGDGGAAFRTEETSFVDDTDASRRSVTLHHGVIGASWEIIKPQYHLADRVDVPDNVDWDKTYEAFLATYPDDASLLASGFAFSNDKDFRGVYLTRGGTLKFTWYLTDGSAVTKVYICAATAQDRPKRIYWTDPPFNGEKISLTGKFVKFFGDSTLVGMKRTTVTNVVADVSTVQEKVVEGLYLDESSMTLEARGTRTGQAVMVYFADGTYDQVLFAQVIEVCRPDTIACRGEIGTPLKPTGRGYSVSNLVARVKAGSYDTTNGTGDYLYQHYGEYSYYPHYGDVYPIRPTRGERWKAEVWWMEEDPMHVQWPFEIDQYESDWPENTPVFVRGDVKDDPGRAITIPDPYVAELMTYQEPNDGYASYSSTNKTFTVDFLSGTSNKAATNCYALLKLTANNNIWFMPIRAVLHSNTNFYTLKPVSLPVGQEATLDGVPKRVLTTNDCTIASSGADVGYVYASGTPNLNYDANLYSPTNSASAIYPVSTNGDIEVWWSVAATRDDMPKSINIPSLPIVYRPYWPTTEQAPQIVLASQLGSAGESRYGHFGAATFDATNAALSLPPRTYFPNGSGTVMLWTRASIEPSADETVLAAPSWLVNFSTQERNSYGLRIGENHTLELMVNLLKESSVSLPVEANGNDWMHVAFSFGKDGNSQAFVNGRRVADWSAGSATDRALSDYLNGVTIGTPVMFDVEDTNALISAYSTAFTSGSSAPATYLQVGSWDEASAALGRGESVRLTKDFVMSGSTAYITKDCTIDLAGRTITVNSTSAGGQRRVFRVNSGVLTLQDSVGGGRIVGTSGHIFESDGGFLAMDKTGGFVMKGGTISNFSCGGASGGGTIAPRGNTFFRMEGGTIEKCGDTSSCACGAINVWSPATFVMTGGTITDCSSRGWGGALSCGDAFIMTGGRIANCTSAGCGGAVSTTKMYLLGGEITGNKASIGGGGIICSSTFGMYGGSVYGNTAPTFPCIALSGTQATGTFTGGEVDVEPKPLAYSRDGASAIQLLGYEKSSVAGRYRLGSGLDCTVAAGRQVAEVLVYDHALTDAEITDEMVKVHTGSEAGVTGYWSFRPGEDLAATGVTPGDETRTFVDRGREDDEDAEPCKALNVILTTPGAPLKSSSVLVSTAEPTIYRQNDKNASGYNPNEEHAFVSAGSGGHVVWALRCDLGEDGAPQAVLAEYAKDGRNALQLFHVVATNETWPALGATCYAGRALPGPLPLTTFDDPWLTNDTWTGTAVFRDRKKQLWCVDGGAKPFDIYMWYRQQDTFDWPRLTTPPEVGDAVPWLAALVNRTADVTGKAAKPHPWRWTPQWPETVPTMKIGQTLTVAEDGLPEVWAAKSVAIVYPDPRSVKNVVVLSDPTVQQSVKLSKADFDATGLTVGGNGGLTLRAGIYRFTEASPFLSTRLGYDPNSGTEGELFLTGTRVAKNAGVTILYPNVLSVGERNATRNLVKSESSGKSKWDAAVNLLATGIVEPNTADSAKKSGELVISYGAVDHYALTARGTTNYVVIIENDATADTMKGGVNCPVAAGDPINMHVFKVIPKYYCGRVVTREDENNLLSQQLSVLYTDPIGGKADDFEFEWKKHAATSDGSVPSVAGSGWSLRSPSQLVEGGSSAGLTRFVVGQQGDTLDNMVNTYWTCRYRAVEGTDTRKVMGDQWSELCDPPALAEGWVQRVLNNVTPFNQRMTDLMNNKAETAVSMLQQAGAPFTGDVALNQDNLTNIGLIQLYETLLNKAESMSILLGASGSAACQQLLLAAERLHDLYKVLGDEAYSDAKNPTIGFGSTVTFSGTTQTAVDFGAESSSLFCFDNQVKTLLDEEICLLRGRTGASAPTCRIGPYYNRLLWNFTKGITAGEVAYAVNYGVSGTETLALSEEQAARLYPQGHGDAYGHYLSALKGWYRLLRNPNFNWGEPVQGTMNLADAAINVDYYEEAKFAEAAVDVAKTAADVVDLTARQAWRESADDGTIAGYFDSNTTNAFGYGEWASRGAYGALVNWAVANSLLPIDASLSTSTSTSDLDSSYTDTGLTRIDRGNTDELAELCEQAAAIVRAVDRIDGGMNPLGLSDHAIPFDITPKGVTDGSNTHYEQVRDRAKTALANARAVLDRAQVQSNRMKMIQETAESYANAITSEEEDLENQLVGYYGTPYTGDIGAGKTYAQGYTGPDTIHYFYMDLDQYGLDENDITNFAASAANYSGAALASMTSRDGITSYVDSTGKTNFTVSVNISRLGLVVKPSSVTGYRTSPGTIQEKYAEFLLQLAEVKAAEATVNKAKNTYERVKNRTATVLDQQKALLSLTEIFNLYREVAGVATAALECNIANLNAAAETSKITGKLIVDAGPGVASPVLTDIQWPKDVQVDNSTLTFTYTKNATANAAYSWVSALEIAKVSTERILEGYKAAIEYDEKLCSLADELRTAAEEMASANYAYKTAATKLNSLADVVAAEVQTAEAVLTKRENLRKRQVDQLSQLRYNEMLFRKIRDKTLTRYQALFDLAQKYVYMASQVYDYETGLKRTDEGSGDAFKAKIVATRALGAFTTDGEPMVADDGDIGLAGYLAQMDANWLVLKPRLGINNPQNYTTWFSLRQELFRIYGGTAGDSKWAEELGKYWVEDIRETDVYRRQCQAFQSQFGLKDKEPGLVIPFSTTIDFAKNFFGHDLAGGDHGYDSTWYSTRIAAAGVWFDGYNELTTNAAKTATAQLAATPTVYLIPAGNDCLRVPGLSDGTFWSWSVVDQVIPAPYAIGSYELDDDTWYPSLADADWGEASPTAKIRKHPMFRAYYGVEGAQPGDERLDATRLVGRSVWNDQWYLIIPAGALNADRDLALSVFINGLDTNRDGKRDLKPVSDIKIGFRTYSQSGN